MAKNILLSKKFWFLIVLFAGIVLPNKSDAQSREYLLKAGYIEKFTHFVEWPRLETAKDSVFKIAVIGNDDLGPALKEMFRGVKVKNRAVQISFIQSVSQINHAMILVISGALENDQLEQVINYTKGRQVLTISENKGYGKKGIIINMFKEDNYIRYEINTGALAQSGLKINSLLLNYAVIVQSDD